MLNQAIVIEEKPNLPLPHLQKIWEKVEAKADSNIFLSWSWIRSWLTTINFPYTVIVAYTPCNAPCGIGVLIKSKTKRNIIVRSNQLFLHRTGDAKYDQPWIEYNKFLVVSDNAKEISEALLKYVIQNLKFDEFIIGLTEQKAELFFKDESVKMKVYSQQPSYQVNFSTITRKYTCYLDSLSKNTKQQIKRSIKLYKKSGDLSLHQPHNIKDALQYFDNLKENHIARWGASSGFHNPIFINFHKTLINNAFEKGQISLLKITAGNKTVGLLYNLIDSKTVRFYMSSLPQAENNQLKPGLVAHSLAIEYYIKQGMLQYDFMAGDSRYKRSLSNEISLQQFVCLQKSKAIFKLEDVCRSIVRRTRLKF